MRSIMLAVLVLVGGCLGCAPRKTINLDFPGDPKEVPSLPNPHKVLYAPKVISTVQNWFTMTRDGSGVRVEMAFCAFGYIKDNTAFVLHLEQAVMTRQVADSVAWDPTCELEGRIALGHIHPNGPCGLSSLDVNTVAVSAEPLHLLVCPLLSNPSEATIVMFTRKAVLDHFNETDP